MRARPCSKRDFVVEAWVGRTANAPVPIVRSGRRLSGFPWSTLLIPLALRLVAADSGEPAMPAHHRKTVPSDAVLAGPLVELEGTFDVNPCPFDELRRERDRLRVECHDADPRRAVAVAAADVQPEIFPARFRGLEFGVAAERAEKRHFD